MPVPLKVVCCYAHEDREMLEQLRKHLMPLQRQGQIIVWSDADFHAGVDWEQERHRHLEDAQLILLLISSDFISSDICYSTEMTWAMNRHDRGEACIIPILLRPVHWEGTPLGKLHALPSGKQPSQPGRTAMRPFGMWLKAFAKFCKRFRKRANSGKNERSSADERMASRHCLAAILQAIGLSTSGSLAWLAYRLSVKTSWMTILRRIIELSTPAAHVVTVLAVDDFH